MFFWVVGVAGGCDRGHMTYGTEKMEFIPQGATVKAKARLVPCKIWVLQGPRHQRTFLCWCR